MLAISPLQLVKNNARRWWDWIRTNKQEQKKGQGKYWRFRKCSIHFICKKNTLMKKPRLFATTSAAVRLWARLQSSKERTLVQTEHQLLVIRKLSSIGKKTKQNKTNKQTNKKTQNNYIEKESKLLEQIFISRKATVINLVVNCTLHGTLQTGH